MMSQKKLPQIKIPSAKNDDQPASRGMLRLVRDELKSEIRSLDRKMDARFSEFDAKFEARFGKIDARFSEIDARFNAIDARFNAIDVRFKGVDARFDAMDARFEDLTTELKRALVLFEEQNSNNRIVLEGLQALWQRQDRIEKGLR